MQLSYGKIKAVEQEPHPGLTFVTSKGFFTPSITEYDLPTETNSKLGMLRSVRSEAQLWIWKFGGAERGISS